MARVLGVAAFCAAVLGAAAPRGSDAAPAPPPMVATITPVRVLDTRVGEYLTTVGPSTGTVQTGMTLVVPVGSAVPTGTQVALVNVTATDALRPGFATIHDCSSARPEVSNVNFSPGAAHAAASFAPLGPDGTVCIYTDAPTALIVDVTGYVPGIGYVAGPRIRLVDTRETTIVRAGETLRVPMPTTSAVVTVTATDSQGEGFVSAGACGDHPSTSTLNTRSRTSVANTTIIQGSELCVSVSVDTHILVDQQGRLRLMYAFPTRRLVDTRADGAKVAAGSTFEFRPADHSLPSLSMTVALNLTATEAADDGFITMHPCGTAPTNSSVLNMRTGGTVANMIVVDAAVPTCFDVSATTHLLVDLIAPLSRFPLVVKPEASGPDS